ncbi:hypothetical protein [Acinetobacter sp. NIPH 2699]|uniref:hypothetical protein n=1 Tax=Acinetobacter sp. NIPH 2699 TaxID=2923433 RepID=UPI001F4C2C6F|nr:hypothetical protein [Acinetobacter sp. NIPH 2699]MCH7337926.1 hypothetical protein [Acinetobacter sp. NIPH 2699]
MKLGFVSVLVLIFISGCSFADDSNAFEVKSWEIKENKELNDLGINVMYIDNSSDHSKIMISDKNGSTSAISSTRVDNRIGIQYEDNSSEIKYIKISPWNKSGIFDSSYIKLFRNENDNWVLVEYADRSEKKVLRKAELK